MAHPLSAAARANAECSVCMEPFTLDGQDPAPRSDHRPRSLLCGHHFCSSCVGKLLAMPKADRACFVCRRPVAVQRLEQVGVAYGYIEALQNAIETNAVLEQQRQELEAARAELLKVGSAAEAAVAAAAVSTSASSGTKLQQRACSKCACVQPLECFSVSQSKLPAHKRKCKECIAVAEALAAMGDAACSSSSVCAPSPASQPRDVQSILAFLQADSRPADAEILRACRELAAAVIDDQQVETAVRLGAIRVLNSVLLKHVQAAGCKAILQPACDALCKLTAAFSRDLPVEQFCTNDTVDALGGALISSGRPPAVVDRACDAISNLVFNPRTRPVFAARAENIELVVSLLRVHVAQREVVQNLCQALAGLAASHLDAIRACDGIAIVFHTMSKHHTDERVVQQCVYALVHLTARQSSAEVFHLPTPIQQVLRTMKEFVDDASVVGTGYACLVQLIRDSRDRGEVASQHGVPIILKGLTSHRQDARVVRMACGVIACLTEKHAPPAIRRLFLRMQADTLLREVRQQAPHAADASLCKAIDDALDCLAVNIPDEFFA